MMKKDIYETESKPDLLDLRELYSPQVSKYTTANSFFKSSFMERPSSAIHKVIDKFSALSGLGSASIDTASPLDIPKHMIDQEGSASNKNGAKNVHQALTKVIKEQQKMGKPEADFNRGLLTWGDSINDYMCRTSLREMVQLLSSQRRSELILNKCRENIRMQLNIVVEKEKEKNRLLEVRIKTLDDLKKCNSNHGDNSTNARTQRDKLEVANCNLQVIENQYIRAIAVGLKLALVEYCMTLESITSSLNNETKECCNAIKAAELESDFSKNSPSKYGVNQPEYSPERRGSSMITKNSENKRMVSDTTQANNSDFDHNPYEKRIKSIINEGGRENRNNYPSASRILSLDFNNEGWS